ncbi:MAG: DUF6452 family protein [Bacteroidales bacterium]|nr:DUF6452 family protein [Bacteroidales bacterium]
MMRRSPLTAIILSAFCFVLMSSCTPGACFEDTEAFLKATFYENESKKAISPDSVSLWGSGMGDKMIYNRAARVQPALLPLDASSGEVSFVIRINGTDDTISFRYSSYPHFISKECGYTFFHNLDMNHYSSTSNIIDTIVFRKGNITTANEENIRIYY